MHTSPGTTNSALGGDEDHHSGTRPPFDIMSPIQSNISTLQLTIPFSSTHEPGSLKREDSFHFVYLLHIYFVSLLHILLFNLQRLHMSKSSPPEGEMLVIGSGGNVDIGTTPVFSSNFDGL